MVKIISYIVIKLFNFFRKIQYAVHDLELRQYCNCPPSVKFMPGSKVVNLSKKNDAINIGRGTVIRGEVLVFAHGGEIDIGEYCYIGESSRLWSAKKIKIGDRVLIAHNVNIHDANDHPIDPGERHEHYKQIITSGHPAKVNMASAEIIIEDDAWIGFNSIILKGVTIGRGAIIAAGTVVTKDIEPFCIVAGNPLKVVGRVKESGGN